MESILNLSPEQFRAALAELQLDPAREAMLVEQYNAANAPQQGGRDRGMLRNLLDNIIGFDDEVVTPGERLGAGVEQFASGLLSDPLGMAGDIAQGGYETIERAMAPGATPMDVMGAAGMAMGAGGLLTRPAGSVGMGGRVNKEDLDPYRYQSTRLRDYLDRTEIDARELPIAPRTPRSWEETEGMVVVPFYGDRTAGQREILGVEGNRFSAPVLAEGGVDFMRGPAAQADNAIWASNSNITSRLQNTAADALRQFQDREILGVTGSMAPNANDFATFTAETIAEMMPTARVSAADARRFDDVMLAQDPTFPGVFSDQLRSWAASTTSPMRKSFIRLMEASPMQQTGFPSPGVGRYAVTDPTQRNMPAGQFGLGAAIMDPSAPRLFNTPRGNQYQAQVPHSTYNTQITGQYFGSLPPVPQGLLFRDLYDRMEGQTTKAGQPLTEAHRTHAIKTIVPAQEMTPRVIEGILQYLSRADQ